MISIKVTKETISKIYRPVQNNTHKGIQGHVLIIGGSYGKIGAALLSSKAALHAGCGLVTAFVPKIGYQILQTAIPEVMVLTDKNEMHISNIDFLRKIENKQEIKTLNLWENKIQNINPLS